MPYLFRRDDSTRHVWKRDDGCIQHHVDNRFSGEESWGYHSRRGPPTPVPSSDSVDSADVEYNSVKQLSITENSAESRASEARIPEPQFPSLLLSLCLAPSPTPRLVSQPPAFWEETRRRLISVAPETLNALSCQNERLSDLLLRLALCVPSIRNRIGLFADGHEGGMIDVIPFFGARIVGILDFPIYCAASRFDFPVYRASRYEFSHLPRVTLCSLRQAQSAPIALFRYRHF